MKHSSSRIISLTLGRTIVSRATYRRYTNIKGTPSPGPSPSPQSPITTPKKSLQPKPTPPLQSPGPHHEVHEGTVALNVPYNPPGGGGPGVGDSLANNPALSAILTTIFGLGAGELLSRRPTPNIANLF